MQKIIRTSPPKNSVGDEARVPSDRWMEKSEAGNFTPRACQVLALGRREADRMHHNFLGTEHLLLGLLKLGQGVAVNVLQARGLDLDKVREEIEKQVGTGPDQKMLGHVPYTPRVKKVIASAQKEAKQLHHTYVGTEHLLLGLLREADGVAAKVLKSLDVNLEETRTAILKELDPNFQPEKIQENDRKADGDASAFAEFVNRGNPQKNPQSELIDIGKRYDVYCSGWKSETVVHRNVRFKAPKWLFAKNRSDLPSEFVELEQADGQTIFVARYSIIKFCEPGTTPDSRPV